MTSTNGDPRRISLVTDSYRHSEQCPMTSTA